MALTDIQAALGKTFAPLLVRAWNRSSELLARTTIASGGGQGGGQHVGWDVQFSGATADTFAEGSDIGGGEFSADVEKPATLPWGQYRAAFKLSNLELNVAASNPGNAQELEKLLEERMFDAIAKITSLINQDLIAGTGTRNGNPSIVGILEAFKATGTYAGLSKTTYPEWAGNVIANGGVDRALTLDLLAKAEQAMFVTSGSSVDFLVTTPGIRTKYEALFNAIQRIVTNGGPVTRFDGSSEDLFWRGKPVLRDKDMTAKKLVGVRADGVELRMLPWAQMPEKFVPSTVRELVSSNGESKQSLGSFVNVYPIARTGSAVKFVAEIYCQAKVQRTNAHFLVEDISET